MGVNEEKSGGLFLHLKVKELIFSGQKTISSVGEDFVFSLNSSTVKLLIQFLNIFFCCLFIVLVLIFFLRFTDYWIEC